MPKPKIDIDLDHLYTDDPRIRVEMIRKITQARVDGLWSANLERLRARRRRRIHQAIMTTVLILATLFALFY
ncbi:MAG TPA: hypothetical protein VMT55_01710 [Candidatus Sulfotelmatobacter sp.]|nr:hypothetical protein [Candidatus Sulfotelmatobacter sp.]